MTLAVMMMSAALAAPQAAPAAPAALNVTVPELAGTAADPTCGGKPALAERAFCVATTQAAMQGQADEYDASFRTQGWIAAAGGQNLTVYVRRRDGGGCDGFQILAFADETRQPAPTAPGYFAFAAIPGDVCAASGAAPAPQAQTPAQ